MTYYAVMPATIFGEFGFHFLGIMAACGVLTLVGFRRAYHRKASRMVLAWMLATALASLLVLTAAVFGTAIMVTSIMVQELEQELLDPPERPLYPKVHPDSKDGNVEDIQ